MIIKNISHGGWASNCYYVTTDDRAFAIVIDPSVPPAFAMQGTGDMPTLSAIVLTHAHFDHMSCLDAWRALGAPVLISLQDASALGDPVRNASTLFGRWETYLAADRLLHQNDEITFGDEVLRVLATPGHTPGSICLSGDGILFVGDTIFAGGGIGRFDLPGGSYDALCNSIDTLLALDGATRVFPGHGVETTIGQERTYHGK